MLPGRGVAVDSGWSARERPSAQDAREDGRAAVTLLPMLPIESKRRIWAAAGHQPGSMVLASKPSKPTNGVLAYIQFSVERCPFLRRKPDVFAVAAR